MRFPRPQTHPEHQVEGEHQVFDAHLSSRQRSHGGAWAVDHTSAGGCHLVSDRRYNTREDLRNNSQYAEWGYLPTRRHWYARRAVRACSGPPPHITDRSGKASGGFFFFFFFFPPHFYSLNLVSHLSSFKIASFFLFCKPVPFLYYFCRGFLGGLLVIFNVFIAVLIVLIFLYGNIYGTLSGNFQALLRLFVQKCRWFSNGLIDMGAYSLSSVWVLPAHNGTAMHRAGTRCGLFCSQVSSCSTLGSACDDVIHPE